MNDDKAKQAAEASAKKHYPDEQDDPVIMEFYRQNAIKDFLAGIKWRDENPSEAVLAVLRALQNILDKGNLATQGNWDDTQGMKQIAYEVLAQWKRESGS